MTTNGNGAKRKLNITKGLTIVGLIMLFIVLAFCVYQMAIGGKNEEHLASIALRCTTFIFGLIIAFHGKELVKTVTDLVLSVKGAASDIIDKVSNDEPDTVD